MIPVFIVGAASKVLPFIGRYWRELLIVILVLVIVFLRGCGNKPIETREVKVMVVDTLPRVRSIRANIDLVDSIYESIYKRMKDSVRVVRMIRDRVEVIQGRTVVVKDTIFQEMPQCWILYRETLEKLKETKFYLDTIPIYDTIRKRKIVPHGEIVIKEEVEDNTLKNRIVWYNGFATQQRRKWRIYIGVNGSYEETYAMGFSIVMAWPKIGIGYSNQLIPIRNFHQIHLLYNIR